MKVTKRDTGELVLAVPEAWNVSSALAEGRDVGHPLIFSLAHDDAVKLALAIAVIPTPDTMDPHVAVPRDLLEELVYAASHGLDILYGSEAIGLEKTLAQAKTYLPEEEATPKQVCPNCGSTKSSWLVHKQAGPHAPPQPHNRMSLNDVQVLVIRACDDCSETLERMDAEDFIDKVVHT